MGGGAIQLANLPTSATRPIRLATYSRSLADGNHADPDLAFWGWNDIWLHAPFREWSIEAEIGNIHCPVLAVQGLDDEYGTLEQIHGIARRVADAKVVELADCGHSPHRDQADELIHMVTRFIGDSSKVTRFSAVASEGE
jgi:pimeloyl-ACP methyl ester carboxylesterase